MYWEVFQPLPGWTIAAKPSLRGGGGGWWVMFHMSEPNPMERQPCKS